MPTSARPDAAAVHRWLEQLAGEWSYRTETTMAPGEPPSVDTGGEHVRAIGGGWIVAEGRSDEPGGGLGTTILTLGFDPAKGRVVGTVVSSAMPVLWIYDGALDPAANALTLDTEGPSLVREGETGRYRDTIELRGDGERVLTSRFLDDDGAWRAFMTTRYRRRG